MILRAAAVVTLAVTMVACGGDDEPPRPKGTPKPSPPCPAGELLLEGGGCLAAGMQENGCAAGEMPGEGGVCVPAGVPPGSCMDGFEPDGSGGCRAIVPAEPCKAGMIAVPGDTSCHEVAPCGSGKWGDIPVEPDTQYVDGTYAGMDSDGTSAKPWPTIQEAIAAAAKGAIVAIAEGSYAEDLVVKSKDVRLWGRCPALVEVLGQSETGAVFIRGGASGTEIRDLAIRGPQIGLVLSGSLDVVLDRVWIHGTGWRAIDIEAGLGPTSARVERSLFEGFVELGVLVQAAKLELIASVVRDGKPAPGGTAGVGVTAQIDPSSGTRADATVQGSLFERNYAAGIIVQGSDAVIEGSLFRDIHAQVSDGEFGAGITVTEDGPAAAPSNAQIRGCVIERCVTAGIYVGGSTAEVEATTVTDTDPSPTSMGGGVGLLVDAGLDTHVPSQATIRSSQLKGNHSVGIAIQGSTATVEGTHVIGTLPLPDGTAGAGIQVAPLVSAGLRGSLVLSGSVLEQLLLYGIGVFGSDATIQGSVVRDVLPQQSDQTFGEGIAVVDDERSMTRSSASVRGSVIERCNDVGAYVLGSDAVLEATVVRATASVTGSFGDGLCVFHGFGDASMRAAGMVIEASARAGVSAYGGAISLESTRFECNAIDLDSEQEGGVDPAFDDAGNNVCGCQGAEIPCQIKTLDLAAPAAPAG